MAHDSRAVEPVSLANTPDPRNLPPMATRSTYSSSTPAPFCDIWDRLTAGACVSWVVNQGHEMLSLPRLGAAEQRT